MIFQVQLIPANELSFKTHAQMLDHFHPNVECLDYLWQPNTMSVRLRCGIFELSSPVIDRRRSSGFCPRDGLDQRPSCPDLGVFDDGGTGPHLAGSTEFRVGISAANTDDGFHSCNKPRDLPDRYIRL